MVLGAYFWVTEGWTVRNLSILDAIGELVRAYDIPWVLQADFNNTPDTLMATGWVADVGGTIFSSAAPTCQGKGGGRVIDYFVVDTRIARAFGAAEVLDAPTSPRSSASEALPYRRRIFL